MVTRWMKDVVEDMSRSKNDRPLLIKRTNEEEEERAYDERDLDYGVGFGGGRPFSWRKLWRL